MAVLPMERIHLSAMRRDRKKILELLQRRGVVEVREGAGEDEVFTREDTGTTCALFEKNAETAEKAIEILMPFSEEKKPFLAFLNGREAITVETNDSFVKVRDTVQKVAYRVVQLQHDIGEANAEILRVEGQLEALVPWMDLPVPQTFAGTKKTAAFVGSVEGETDASALLEKLAVAAPQLEKLHLEVVHASKEQTIFYLLVLKADAAAAEEALRAVGFARPAGASRRMPAEQKKRLEDRRAEAEKQIAEAEEELKGYVDRMDDLRFLQDHMRMRAEKYEMVQRVLQSRHVFVLEGYLPARAAPALQGELEGKFQCAVELADAPRDDEVPVLLQNNRFSRPAETVLENYSLPGKEDIDPTSVMSIFYYFMFGLMFSDAGYGAIMAAVCGVLLLTKRNMEDNWKKNLGLFFWCGVSTIFWGVMFGSYFGDLIPVFSGHFLGNALLVKPVWLDPLAQPMTLLMFCLGLGVIHLSFGMIMKAIALVRLKQYKDIVYDVVFPLMVIYPLIIVLMGSEMFAGMAGFMLALPAMANTVCLALAGVGALGVLVTGGRESRNWFKRLLKGAYALYNVVAGWLGDILSYSRLLALGLATGVIASVMNSMGTMVGGGIPGLIAFVVIFAVGQALNFGINVLGAYVHSNRLEYVEFFGKFYEGGGQKFAPFGIHTKYYKIQEDNQNV